MIDVLKKPPREHDDATSFRVDSLPAAVFHSTLQPELTCGFRASHLSGSGHGNRNVRAQFEDGRASELTHSDGPHQSAARHVCTLTLQGQVKVH